MFPRVSEAEVARLYPHIKNQIGSDFSCVDIDGFKYLSSEDRLVIQVQDTSATMYIKRTSINEILYDQNETALKIFSTSSYSSSLVSKPLAILKCVIYDKLYINYEPTIINTVDSEDINSAVLSHTYPANYTYFETYVFYPTAITESRKTNYLTIVIERKNLGQILGAILSWISILALIIGFIVAPLMDRLLNLLTA